ncbi:uncharacterized protein TRAVEDRAFT_43950 [Trametes versicolor FP-101664 SS1]|uniref:uncharacterized protein n=1 Tax=Trametes versicolor (strain FP-101664) TaxID=717944 RepID=UPI0004624590|nr:uncharacterized protein TRAVEDRAFT_43950 [Trametes versicolor FP-101664 SS1]EIW63672.1 hypothetical protein TRAVEDRAFT_43950 [Trametes versicolor FP-101664 SS1]
MPKERKPRASRYVRCVGPQPKFGPDGEYLGVQWQDKRVGLKESEFRRKWEESQTPEERQLEREWQWQQTSLLRRGHRQLIPPRPKPTATTADSSEPVAGPSKTAAEEVAKYEDAKTGPSEVQPGL